MFDLPVLIHTPHRDKKRGTERSLAMVREQGFPEERVLIDHNTEETLPLVLETACWAGHSIYPDTKMDEPRMAALVKKYGSARILINSAADWGASDPLKVPKTATVMREFGIPDEDIELIVWTNPHRRSSAGPGGSMSTNSLMRPPSTRPHCSGATLCCAASRPVGPRIGPAR